MKKIAIMIAFDVIFPEIFKNETIILKTLDDSINVSETFVCREYYCIDLDCECCMVDIVIFNKENKQIAQITAGWKDKKFYINHFKNAENIDFLPGPSFAPGTVQIGEFADSCLDFFKNSWREKNRYYELIKKHYQMIREKVANARPFCFCGSKKIFDKCCKF